MYLVYSYKMKRKPSRNYLIPGRKKLLAQFETAENARAYGQLATDAGMPNVFWKTEKRRPGFKNIPLEELTR